MDKVKIIDLVKQIQKKQMTPEEKEKWTKEAALYVYRPETNYRCDECVFSKMKSTKCALYGPLEDIKAEGSCGLWIHMDPGSELADKVPYLSLVTKLETGYVESKTGFSCKRCEYFLPGKQDCKKVRKDSPGDTLGIIDPNACCNKWEKDKDRVDMTDKQLEKALENK